MLPLSWGPCEGRGAEPRAHAEKVPARCELRDCFCTQRLEGEAISEGLRGGRLKLLSTPGPRHLALPGPE